MFMVNDSGLGCLFWLGFLFMVNDSGLGCLFWLFADKERSIRSISISKMQTSGMPPLPDEQEVTAEQDVSYNLHEVAKRLCSSDSSIPKNNVKSILDFIVYDCKIEEANNGIQFLQVVQKCAYNCCNSAYQKDASFCTNFATCLNEMAGHYRQVTHIYLILRLYAVGLFLACEQNQFGHLLVALWENKELIQSQPEFFSYMPSDEAYQASYVEALTLLCRPLSSSLNSEWARIANNDSWMAKYENFSIRPVISLVEDAFCHLCQLIGRSLASGKIEDDKNSENLCITALDTALAACALSFITNVKLEESTQQVKDTIAIKWIETESLEDIIFFVNRIVKLFLDKSNKVSMALSFNYEASWLYIQCHGDNLLEDCFVKHVKKISKNSAKYLVILGKISYINAKNKLIETLKNWCDASYRFEKLEAPIFVKHWVQIECNHKVDGVDRQTIYNLLPPTIELSTRNIWAVLEQELMAYQEMSHDHPRFCQKMKSEIMCILLEKIYIPLWFQKAHTQIEKQILVDESSTQCLSDALLILEKISDKMDSVAIPVTVRHQLCAAYCLHELCTLVSKAYSEGTLGDVKAPRVNISHVDCSGDAFNGKIMNMLYSIYDMIQMKGFVADAEKLIIKIKKLELKKISIEKFLSSLFETRRLTHAFCVSSVNVGLVQKLSDGFDKVESWLRLFEKKEISLCWISANFFDFVLTLQQKKLIMLHLN